MRFDDTGQNIPESETTLLLQQERLLEGRRPAQMFPKGTKELRLPEGMERVETPRGIFHFNPKMLSREKVELLSQDGRENFILDLGPYPKGDIVERIKRGEFFICITEYSPEGVEVRSAIGTTFTLPEQLSFFNATKGKDCSIIVGKPPARVTEKYNGARL